MVAFVSLGITVCAVGVRPQSEKTALFSAAYTPSQGCEHLYIIGANVSIRSWAAKSTRILGRLRSRQGRRLSPKLSEVTAIGTLMIEKS
jgi:hypothetical protein